MMEKRRRKEKRVDWVRKPHDSPCQSRWPGASGASPPGWAAPVAATSPALEVRASDRASTSSVHPSVIAPHWRCYSNIISDTFLFVLSLSGYRRAAFKPQQIASVTLNACEQIALWNRKRGAPAATSASRLWLETPLHYTSSKTYPLFMGPYFNTISTSRTTHLNTCMFLIKGASTVKETSPVQK